MVFIQAGSRDNMMILDDWIVGRCVDLRGGYCVNTNQVCPFLIHFPTNVIVPRVALKTA